MIGLLILVVILVLLTLCVSLWTLYRFHELDALMQKASVVIHRVDEELPEVVKDRICQELPDILMKRFDQDLPS